MYKVTKALTGILCLGLVFCSGCGSTVMYARATKLPEETQGFMRLAQSSVKVNVVGKDTVSNFKVEQPGAYVLVHEQDVKQLVQNTKKYQAVLDMLRVKDPGIYSEALKVGE